MFDQVLASIEENVNQKDKCYFTSINISSKIYKKIKQLDNKKPNDKLIELLKNS